MDTFLLIAITGLGLGSLYFLLASGLSLIFGLMRVLSFAHGAFLTVSAYVAWSIMRTVGDGASTGRLVLAIATAVLAGGVLAFGTEVLIIRPLKGRTLEQLMATVGLGTAIVALLTGFWGPDERNVPLPSWVTGTTHVFGAAIPTNRFLLMIGSVIVLVAIRAFLSYTRYGLVIRAGVENSEMVSALGINVNRSFTLVFTVGGLLAGLGGALAACYYHGVNPMVGDQTMLYAFIVVIIGGLGSIGGAAIAAAALGLLQSLANYYISAGLGDVLAVVLLAAVLLLRPQGLLGRKERLA
ncbi:branched-chain amino acid ABC transporter permease [Amycolatopsis jejuensis]|uniref:branched-chain amino acid ABC transporter permease n=1 Tax=Amycolatopsis jejuensis TaxID=330084 RepID=UPI00052440DB|nr:branched-chain amino acid ABC transporter permease [Amycolatopsis jejuensis]